MGSKRREIPVLFEVDTHFKIEFDCLQKIPMI